jgi:hypothetical protein
MQAYLQTVQVRRPGSDMIFTTEAVRPVPPPELQKTFREQDRPVGILCKDGTVIQWFPTGLTVVIKPDGTEYDYWAKPNRVDAVNYAQGDGGFFRFFPDGSVMARCFGETIYYWGPDLKDIPPVEGDELHAEYIGDGRWKICEFGQHEERITTCSLDGGASCNFCEKNYDEQRREEDDCGCCGRSCGCCQRSGYSSE